MNEKTEDLEDIILDVQAMKKVLHSNSYRFELSVPNLKLKRGRFYGLVGKSGSGKSTMLDLLAMVSHPTEVECFQINANGRTIDLAKLLASKRDDIISEVRLRNFGYILQSGGLFSFLSVRENLELPFRLGNLPINVPEMERVIRAYEIHDHLDKKPSELSVGQRQRVSILRSLCLKPEIVLADEPTASVDENMADVIVQELKAMAAQLNTTVLMVSHDLDLVNKVADEIHVLRPVAMGENATRSELSIGEVNR